MMLVRLRLIQFIILFCCCFDNDDEDYHQIFTQYIDLLQGPCYLQTQIEQYKTKTISICNKHREKKEILYESYKWCCIYLRFICFLEIFLFWIYCQIIAAYPKDFVDVFEYYE